MKQKSWLALCGMPVRQRRIMARELGWCLRCLRESADRGTRCTRCYDQRKTDNLLRKRPGPSARKKARALALAASKKGPLPQLIVKTTPPDGKVIWKRWKCPLCGDANFYTAKSCRKHMGLIPNILATCTFYDRK